jgi:hypothetical protein
LVPATLAMAPRRTKFCLVGVVLPDTLARTPGEVFDSRSMVVWGAALGALSTMMLKGIQAETQARAA